MPHSPGKQSAGPVERTSSGKKLLVVEDDPTNLMVMLGFLSGLGFDDVKTACNGKEALRAFSGESFDLVLMDWLMPVMDGVEATRRWRRLEADAGRSQRTPIIAVTACTLDGDREKCLSVGMDDYLTKPFSKMGLAERLQQWLPSSPDVA